ncbi:hypothetical protein [Dactylosporangium sp. NPDC000521]|uniref:hypothetical protein n=1 Tax=Dactylosporangium sp. NPDC000521 TaxID=3363975 RepID=UPI0036937B27
MAERVYERTATGANAGPWPTQLEWQRAADRSPDDFDPDEESRPMVNPDTGLEYGEVDNAPRLRRD